MTIVLEDLTGMQFGRLTVLRRDIERDSKRRLEGKHGTHWICKCNCGNITSVDGYALKSGHTKSCGCYKSERISKRNKEYSSKKNEIIEGEETITLIDGHGNRCLIDKEDYSIVKNWYWRKEPKRGDINKGYWVTNTKIDDVYSSSSIRMHQVIANIKYGEYDHYKLVPDHLSRDTDDNRKCNIVLKTNQDNSHNRGLSKANNSEKTGVFCYKDSDIWTAYITVNYETIYLGRFQNKEDAVRARKDAEKKYLFTCDTENAV